MSIEPDPPAVPDRSEDDSDRSEDDSDRGWGDERPESGDAHEEWLRAQRPPHHGG